MTPRLAVVGIGCDGVAGLSANARSVLEAAERIVGAPRQLALVAQAELSAQLSPWPEGYWRNWADTFAQLRPGRDVVLASGDPMFHGIGTTLARELGAEAITVYPAPSSASLACAYLGWALDETPVVSLVTGDSARVVPLADAGRRFLVLCRSAESVAQVAEVLGASAAIALTALTNLGGSADTGLPQSVVRGSAAAPPVPAGDLTVLAVEPVARRPWLADADFDSDGQLTKAPIRQLTVSALGPTPGARLWDVGGGSGSIAVEWARHGGRAQVFERDSTRVARIRRNVSAFSGDVEVFHGAAPEVLEASSWSPEAIFIGGGLTAADMVSACYERLAPGGVLVANAVTVESEAIIWRAHRHLGGQITRLSVERAGAVGSFTAWRPALPVVQWVVYKPGE